MMIGKLNVRVFVRVVKTVGPNRKTVRKPLSDIVVMMGKDIIATRIIPGTWDNASALNEFKRFPARFKPYGKWNGQQIAACAA